MAAILHLVQVMPFIPDIEIVGVVKDSKTTDLRQELRALVYIPYTQDTHFGNATFYVRTNLEPVALARDAARRRCKAPMQTCLYSK